MRKSTAPLQNNRNKDIESPSSEEKTENANPADESPKIPSWKVMLPLSVVLVMLAWLGVRLGMDNRVIAGSLFIFGLLSNMFTWLLSVIALVPVVGPLIVKVLSIGFIWLINAVGYLVSFIAIRRGYTQDVLTYRGLTIALIIGIVIGYVLGKLV